MNVLILDDNLEVAYNLAGEIKKIFPNFIIECYNNVNKFLLDINSTTSAIIFLDIFMPKTSGIELSNDIIAKNKNVAIIFYSGYPKETFDVYEGTHVYFLEKPFNTEKIKKSITIATSHLNENLYRFEFARKKYAVSMNNIVYFESSARLIRVVTTTETNVFYGTLNEVEKEVGDKFLRVSQSFLINPAYIEKIIANCIILKKIRNSDSFSKINISRSYKKKVMSHDIFNPYN